MVNIAHSREFNELGDQAAVPPFIVRTGTDRHWEQFGYMEIVSPTRRLELTQILGLSLALLLFAGGIWANVGGGSLSQYKGAWVSHASR
jgi:hypothetical protein